MNEDPKPFRERYPGPYEIEEIPGGYRIMSGKTALCYVYVSDEHWATTSSGPKLRRAEGLALAKAIAGLGGEVVEPQSSAS